MKSLSNLPSVDHLLQSQRGSILVENFGHRLSVSAFQEALSEIRRGVLEEELQVPPEEAILDRGEELLQRWTRSSLYPVINASGVIIHTNLGRAPLSQDALQAVREISGGYSTLEFDIHSGGRGSRLIHAAEQFKHLLGAEAALVVNNNASAVLLILTALARDRQVIISRSQLVEIGGGFRIPEVMKQSGAQLLEVGTTNRVHLEDYQRAFGEGVTAVMRAHYSNFSMLGFTAEPELKEIVASAHQAGVWMFDDLGSGALLETTQYGLKHEPMVQESLEAGVDLVCFSGDKLLGGPQAGIILGRKELVAQCQSHPLARAVRPDKTALAALSATLMHYLKGEAEEKVPVWKMISAAPEQLRQRAKRWQEVLKTGQILKEKSMVGGGSLPGETLPTFALALETPNPQTAAHHLRSFTPPIIPRIANDQVLLDPRTVLPEQDENLIDAVRQVWS